MNSELEIAQKIELYCAKRCITARDWVECPSLLKNVTLYRRANPLPEQKFEELLLPESQDVPGYAYAILETAKRLAQFDGRPLTDVLAELQNPLMDRISYRIISENANLGSIDLAGAEKFFGGIIAAIKAAVKDVSKPEISHSRIRGKEIDKLLKESRFGQTQRGSFIVNLFIPVDVQNEQFPIDGLGKNVFREGTIHLMKVMQAAVQSVSRGEVDRFAEKNEKEPFISSNLLSAILDTRLWDDAEIEITAHWTPSVPTDAPTQIYLKQSVFPVFNQWIERFRPLKKETKQQDFRGRVTELSGDERDEDERTFGNVTIAVVSDEGDSFEANVWLKNADLYKIAIKSHELNKFVKFRGDAVRGYQKGTITNIEDFQLDEMEASK